MELFIRIENGVPYEHPIIRDNFIAAFPEINLENLPDWVKPFERVEIPEIGTYEVFEGTTYQDIDGVVKDVHAIRAMTDGERLAKQNAVKNSWTQNGYASWVFDEATCDFLPPVGHPNDDKDYQWDEATTKWIEVAND